MIDEKLCAEIKRLENLYQDRWNKAVDYSVIPKGLTQKQLYFVLRYIVDTGESILVGSNKMKKYGASLMEDIADCLMEESSMETLDDRQIFVGGNLSNRE